MMKRYGWDAGLVTGAVVALFVVMGLLGDPVEAQRTNSVITSGTNTTSTTPESLATSQEIDAVLVQNDPDNTVDILVGSSSSQDIQLAPGQSITLQVDNISTVWIVAASGTPTVNYVATYLFRP